ncbi:hypothetical protein DYI37_01805 [Fulvimarina endophytica]|uniref:Uncharacterized protein n=1 Tax=Fulvimarina endophytica TaxID=2293836 RepID=A0A371XAI2_9HYPH|nr:SH3 domain-containing protein [Fulvimarina endophytica]RFC66221.1 hypothetical protein DYI37_01805 [Fulvimarina endophytica]
MIRIYTSTAAAAFFALTAPVLAQSEADFVAAFSGTWQTLDPSFTKDGACRVELRSQSVDGGFGLSAEHCGGTLSDLDHWAIVDNQLALRDSSNKIVARLGGNQRRINGDTTSGPIVFERVTQSASAGSPSPSTRSPCTYYGYTASCADAKDMSLPEIAPNGGSVEAGVLVALNARKEARSDADVVATIPAGTCVRLEECKSQSGENWCRAQVANFSGWIKQTATRMNRWPILTFDQQCRSSK